MSDDTDIRDHYTQIFNLNTAVAAYSREKGEELLHLAESHDEIADRYRAIADQIFAGAQATAKLLGDALVAEMGLVTFDDDSEENDDDDDE